MQSGLLKVKKMVLESECGHHEVLRICSEDIIQVERDAG